MNVISQPSSFSLSSMMSDFAISSAVDITFEVQLSGKTILNEVYSPDNDNMIYVRGRALGKMLKFYLRGNDFEETTQENISSRFTILIDGKEYATYNVLACRLYTEVAAEEFFKGNAFLNQMHKAKWTAPSAKEYLTCMMLNTNIHVNVVYREGNTFRTSDLKTFSKSNSGKFETFDASFPGIANLFPEIDNQHIVAYKIHSKNQENTYHVDRDNYILPLQFVYKNSFDVPESIYTRGIATRKGSTTFDTSKTSGIERKSNIKRADTFTVSSGRIYSTDEYDYYREMFDSTDVRIFFKGKYRKIIISEENNVEPLRKGNLPPVSFSFRFADDMENNVMLGNAFYNWILEHGIWSDTSVWLDNGIWLDEPRT